MSSISGAKMVVALTIIFSWEDSAWSPPAGPDSRRSWLAVSVGFILLLSRRLKHMAILLVGGIMIGYICSAVTDFIIAFADDADIVNLHGWSLGSFSGTSWEGVAVAGAVVGITSALVFFLSKPIGAYQLGEAYAQSMV